MPSQMYVPFEATAKVSSALLVGRARVRGAVVVADLASETSETPRAAAVERVASQRAYTIVQAWVNTASYTPNKLKMIQFFKILLRSLTGYCFYHRLAGLFEPASQGPFVDRRLV